jgi:hypothetical protein
MIMVTIMNAFIGELEKVSDRHNRALTRVFGKHTAEYIEEVKTTTEGLGAALKDASIDTIRGVFDRHAKTLNDHSNNTKWCAKIIGLSALINVIALIIYNIKG